MNTIDTYQGVRLLKMSIFTIMIGLVYALLISEEVRAKSSPAEFAGFMQVEQSGELSHLYVSRSDNTLPTVSINVQNKLLIDLLHQLADELNMDISINPRKIEDKKVSYLAQDKNIYSVLNDLLLGTELEVQLSKDHKVLIIQEAEEIESTEIFQETVTGRVIDAETGESLPGVNVIVAGSMEATGSIIGTTTDMDGNYEIQVPDDLNTLIFSFIGYQTQEIPINGDTEINVSLTRQVVSGEELVVVGYGIQKRENLTGSVGSVGQEVIKKQIVTQTSQALTGQLSGVTVRQDNSKPGDDNATIRIRGLGTFSQAGSEPLVLVDGISANINDINPNDIKSISVLKDAASAAIYGSRAANGVILIETKKGREGFEVSYDSDVGYNQSMEWPEFLNSWEFAEAINEALTNVGQGRRYSEEDIRKFRSGEDLENYPNNVHRWRDVFSSGNGLQTKHNLTFSGGDSNNTYLFSLGYLKQNGIIERTFNDRYDFRLNIDNKITDRLNLNVSLSGNHRIKENPVTSNNPANFPVLIKSFMRLSAADHGRRADGTYGRIEGAAPEAEMDSQSNQENKSNHFLGHATLRYDIFESLSIRGEAGYRLQNYKDSRYRSSFQVDRGFAFGPSKLFLDEGNNNSLILRSILDFNNSFGVHEIQVLAGYEQENFSSEWIRATRENFPNNALFQLNAGSQAGMTNAGSASEWALLSYFSRITYAYQGKYLFEANARYDGSSRFPKDNRYGFFPSFSAGWRISEEGFFPDLDWMDDLKIRGSWGELGNQEIGAYPYQSVLSLGHNYAFGGSLSPGAKVVTLPNRDISWEKTEMTNLGLDLTLFGGKLDFTTDYFYKKTSGILYNISVTSMLGFNPSEQNFGVVENKGWEFFIRHQNSIGDFSYSITPNFSIVNNKVLELANTQRDVSKGLFVGEPLDAIYGYVADGLFVDEQDIQNYPDQDYNPVPGQPRYMDISGPDGVPDGKVDATYDRKVLGSTFPKYNFGANINAGFKNLDFSLQFQGQAGMQRQLSGVPGRALYNWSNIQRWQYENRWTPENPNRNAKYPRLEPLPENRPTGRTSTYWLQDASYLKIKNLQLGYTLPVHLTNSLNIRNLRLYVNVRNLHSFDNYPKGFDPDGSTPGFWGVTYPLTRVYSFGINLTF